MQIKRNSFKSLNVLDYVIIGDNIGEVVSIKYLLTTLLKYLLCMALEVYLFYCIYWHWIYLHGEDFINDEEIFNKTLSIKRLDFNETAKLLNIKEDKMWKVFLGPIYCGNLCVNNYKYCLLRK